MPRRPIGEVIHAEAERLMAIPGVLGIAESRHAGQPAITVYVAGRTADLVARIPPALGGYPVIVEDTGGPLRAQDG